MRPSRRTDRAKNFNEHRRKSSPERRKRNSADAERMLVEISLQEQRQNITSFGQEEVAEMLQVTQGSISKLEHQDDVLMNKFVRLGCQAFGSTEAVALPDQVFH